MNLSPIGPGANITKGLTYFFLFGAVAVALATLWQIRETWLSDAEIIALQQRNTQVLQALQDVRDHTNDIPEEADIDAVIARIAAYNALVPPGADGLDQFMPQIEQALPNAVRVSTLYYDRRGRLLRLSLLAETEPVLVDALGQFQDVFDKDVALDRQLTRDSARGQLIQYDLVIDL